MGVILKYKKNCPIFVYFPSKSTNLGHFFSGLQWTFYGTFIILTFCIVLSFEILALVLWTETVTLLPYWELWVRMGQEMRQWMQFKNIMAAACYINILQLYFIILSRKTGLNFAWVVKQQGNFLLQQYCFRLVDVHKKGKQLLICLWGTHE